MTQSQKEPLFFNRRGTLIMMHTMSTIILIVMYVCVYMYIYIYVQIYMYMQKRLPFEVPVSVTFVEVSSPSKVRSRTCSPFFCEMLQQRPANSASSVGLGQFGNGHFEFNSLYIKEKRTCDCVNTSMNTFRSLAHLSTFRRALTECTLHNFLRIPPTYFTFPPFFFPSLFSLPPSLPSKNPKLCHSLTTVRIYWIKV